MSPARDAEAALSFAANPLLGSDPRATDYCYQPCATGLHVCGEHPDGENFLTVVNLPVSSESDAEALFNRARGELMVGPGGVGDLVVDLQKGRDCVADFWIHRQMLARLVRLWAADGASVDDVSSRADTKAGSGIASNTDDGAA